MPVVKVITFTELASRKLSKNNLFLTCQWTPQEVKKIFFLCCHNDTSPRSLTAPPVSIAWGTTERPLNHQGGNLARYLEIYTQQVYTSCNLERTLWRHKGHQHLTDTSLPRARCCWKSLTSRNLVLHHFRAASEFCMNKGIRDGVHWTYATMHGAK